MENQKSLHIKLCVPSKEVADKLTQERLNEMVSSLYKKPFHIDPYVMIGKIYENSMIRMGNKDKIYPQHFSDSFDCYTNEEESILYVNYTMSYILSVKTPKIYKGIEYPRFYRIAYIPSVKPVTHTTINMAVDGDLRLIDEDDNECGTFSNIKKVKGSEYILQYTNLDTSDEHKNDPIQYRNVLINTKDLHGQLIEFYSPRCDELEVNEEGKIVAVVVDGVKDYVQQLSKLTIDPVKWKEEGIVEYKP